jgi:hypothetical protein
VVSPEIVLKKRKNMDDPVSRLGEKLKNTENRRMRQEVCGLEAKMPVSGTYVRLKNQQGGGCW